LKLKYDELLSSFAFKYNLRRFSATASFTLNYSPAAIAATSVSPASKGFGTRENITIYGAGFGTTVGDVSVILKLFNISAAARRDAPCVTIIPSPGSATGAAYHNVIGRSLTVMLSGQSNLNGAPGVMQSFRLTPDECPREGCPAPAPAAVNYFREPFVRRWSNATQWPGGVLPAASHDVDVLPQWDMLLDVEPPPLGRLTIRGRLTFDETRANTILAAAAIVVLGRDDGDPESGGELVVGIRMNILSPRH